MYNTLMHVFNKVCSLIGHGVCFVVALIERELYVLTGRWSVSWVQRFVNKSSFRVKSHWRWRKDEKRSRFLKCFLLLCFPNDSVLTGKLIPGGNAKNIK